MINETTTRSTKKAREKRLKGYSRMNVYDLQLLLAGKQVPKKMQKNQVSVGTQTDFRVCNDCSLRQYIDDHLMYRKVIHDDDLKINAEPCEVLGFEVDCSI